MNKIYGILIAALFLYYGIAAYGKHAECSKNGGVLVTGATGYACVQEMRNAE